MNGRDRLPAGGGGRSPFSAASYKLSSGAAAEELVRRADGQPLPERAAVEQRVTDFVERSDGERQLPPEIRARLREDLLWTVGRLYGDPPGAGPSLFGSLLPVGPILEMVVVADGSRPVFFFEDGKLEPGAGNGPFFDAIQRHAAPLEGAARAVGRIESDLRLSPSWTDKWYAGSGFLVAPDLLMTNRHVMQLLVNESSSATGPFSLNGPYWVNFAAELSGGSQRFSLEEVLWAGDAVIDTTVDLARLDMALIRLGAPEDGATLPPPLPVSVGPAAQGEVIYVPGYPGRPGIAPGSEPGADTEIDIVLAQLFDRRFGGKRCASGEIDAIPGSWPDDGRQWTVKHDASTLGGNSGSPILSLSRGPAPVALALHFGGQSRLANYGHVFDQLRQRLAAAGATIA